MVFTQSFGRHVPTQKSTHVCLKQLYLIAQNWKEPRCPSGGEHINKLWYIQTLEYYLALKEISCPAMKRHEEVLSAYYYVKEATLRMLYMILTV